MNEIKRLAKIGPGGYKCVCCGPKPGKERVELRRLVRSRMKAITRKAVETAITEGI